MNAPKRTGKIESIAIGNMTVTPYVQRKIKPAWVRQLYQTFDLDDFGLPVVNKRDDKHYIVDGQHRIEAIKLWIGEGWGKQKIECRVFEGLTEQQEADMFDRLNTNLMVSTFDRFKTRVTARRSTELHIYAIVQNEGLCISQDKIPGAIRAVSTLRRVYTRSSAEVLQRTLRIIRDAFGDSGFEALVIDGIGHMCQRYNGILEESVATTKLNKTHGGVKGLLGRAENLHRQTGNAKAVCVAAAAVDVINSRRGGKKIPSWWKS